MLFIVFNVNYINCKVGIDAAGDTTSDDNFTLLTVECHGSCNTVNIKEQPCQNRKNVASRQRICIVFN